MFPCLTPKDQILINQMIDLQHKASEPKRNPEPQNLWPFVTPRDVWFTVTQLPGERPRHQPATPACPACKEMDGCECET